MGLLRGRGRTRCAFCRRARRQVDVGDTLRAAMLNVCDDLSKQSRSLHAPHEYRRRLRVSIWGSTAGVAIGSSRSELE
jgi:hypothetical protein